MSNNKGIRPESSDSQPPQASASTNSATRAQLSFLDGVSQENGTASSANDNEEKFPAKKIRVHRRPLIAGNQTVDAPGVYFLASADRKRVKIGKAQRISGRIGDIANMNARGLVLVATVPNGYTNAERALHRRFASQRLHGEWFAVNSEIRSVIKGLQSGVIPAEVRREVESDIEEADELRVRRRPRISSSPTDLSDDELREIVQRRAARMKAAREDAQARRFRDVDDVLLYWGSVGGPAFDQLVEIERTSSRFGVHYHGAWLDPSGVECRAERPGVLTLAGAMAGASPRRRQVYLIWAALKEFSDNHQIGSRTGSRTMGLLGAEIGGRNLGSAKYFIPGSACVGYGCDVCSEWGYDGTIDEVEELARVAHRASVATKGWRLGIFGDHWRGCECYHCRPELEKPRKAPEPAPSPRSASTGEPAWKSGFRAALAKQAKKRRQT